MAYSSWKLKNLPPENPTWGITEVLISFIFYVLIKYIFNLLAPTGLKVLSYVISDVHKLNLYYYLISIIISNLLIVLLSIFLVKKRFSTIKELGITTQDLFKGIFMGVISGLIIFLIVIGIGVFFGNVLGMHEQVQHFTKEFLTANSWDTKLILYILAIIIVPLSQAILFQGLSYPIFRSIAGKGLGYLLVAIIYSISFFDLQRGVQLSFAGFILTYIYEESGNLFAPIVANSIWQGLMLWLISVTSWK